MKTPWVLEAYDFHRVVVEASEAPPSTGEINESEYEVKVEPRGQVNKKDPVLWRLTLDIHLKPKEAGNGPYSVELRVVGVFRFDESFPDDKRGTLLHINGSSILYSAAREFILGITARGPYGPLMLPSWSFLPEPKVDATSPEPKKRRKK